MNEPDWLARRFEEHRGHLQAVAYRMLGSRSEAEDAVQEAWLRLSRSEGAAVENLGGWLTTVVGRICLNVLRSRRVRREEPLDVDDPEPAVDDSRAADPADEAMLADSVGIALLMVLDTLEPAERLAFVLHDMFGVPFEEVAVIVERSPMAARKLASRARKRVQNASVPQRADLRRQRAVLDAFLAASRSGDFSALLALLDPDVVLRADAEAVEAAAARRDEGAPPLAREIRGAHGVAEIFAGRARAAQPAILSGQVGAVFAPGGQVRAAFVVEIADGRIKAIEIISDRERLRRLDPVILE